MCFLIAISTTIEDISMKSNKWGERPFSIGDWAQESFRKRCGGHFESQIEIGTDNKFAPPYRKQVAEVDDDGMDMDVEVEDEEMLDEDVSKGSDAEEDESLGMEDGKEADKDMSKKGRRKVARADARKDESTEATDELVEQITKRVAARILKAALAKK